MPDLFDIDKEAGAYTPVQIKLRGVTYTLGDSAVALLHLSDFIGKFDGDLSIENLLRQVRPLMKVLAPDAPEDLNTAEELALLPALTEVLQRFTAITFPAVDASGGADA